MREFVKFTGFAVIAGGLLLSPVKGIAATDPPPPTSGGKCIAASVEQEINKCPEGITLGRKPTGANIGTGDRKVDIKKAKVDKAPSDEVEKLRKDMLKKAFSRKIEAKSFEILKREIELIKRLIKQTSNASGDKAEIVKRLADAYKDIYDQLNFKARELDQPKWDAKEAGNKKLAAKLAAQQKKLLEMAQNYREKSIKAYVMIRDNFPNYPAYDEILFAIAHEIGQMAAEIEDKVKKSAYHEKARIYYQELIRNYPQSKFIPYAWNAFGEYWFHEAKDVDRAMASYKKVVEWGEDNNPNFVIAMYYQAWCLFNMQEYQKTINQFVKVIDYAKENPENQEAKAVARRAKLELVSSFSKIGNPSQAWAFFERVGDDPKTAHKMLVKLSELYYDEGHWADAIIIFHKLEALEVENYLGNNGDDLCNYQYLVTNAVINGSKKAEQLKELRRQLNLYKKFNEGEHDAKKKKQCAQKTVAITWDQAVHWHVEAVGSESTPGTNNRETMDLTTKLYDTILETFPNIDELDVEGFDAKTKPTNYRVAYYKAELLWKTEQWDKCGPAFDAVVEMDPGGVYTPDAAYAAVLCYNKVYVQVRGKTDRTRNFQLRTETSGSTKCPKGNAECKTCQSGCKGGGAKKKRCKKECVETHVKNVLAPKELTKVEKGILKSYERYVCFVKDDKGSLPIIKYRRARIYYEANMFDKAAVLFKDIAMNHSDQETGIFAANLYLDCLNAMGSMIETPIPECYDDLAAIVDVFIDTSKMPGKKLMEDEEFAKQIKSLKVGVLRKRAESLNNRGLFREAADVYLKIYREYKGVYGPDGMCEVLFNTAINMEAARLMMPAIKVREQMIKLYPSCEHSKRAMYYIGANYHALQFFEEAAEQYSVFASKYPGEEEAPGALSNAVMFYIGLGQYDDAWRAVRLYESKYKGKNTAKAATVFFGAGNMLREAVKEDPRDDKKWDAVRKHYTKYNKTYGRVKALDEQVQAHVIIADTYWNRRKPDYTRAEKSYKKALSIFDAKAMDKVAENMRKAAMLNAAAKARFFIAERKFQAFKKVKFPAFKPEKEVPKKIQKWHDKKVGPEQVKLEEEGRKYRRLLVRWGEMTRKDAKKETLIENSTIQFSHWLEDKFVPWFENKKKVLAEATELFASVVKMSVPEWEMAAAARAADMQLEFMQALYDSPIPPAFEEDAELKSIYQASMDEKARPYAEMAESLYARCLFVSKKVHWFNENSLRCEAELFKLAPAKYPISQEMRIQPENEVDNWAVPAAILELESEAQRRDNEMKNNTDEVMDKE